MVLGVLPEKGVQVNGKARETKLKSNRTSHSVWIRIWLILPVVIRSSQRLSHACVSINNYIVKLRMAHYISYSLFGEVYYLDNRSNSRANT